jgi:prevent-host-death family protein
MQMGLREANQRFSKAIKAVKAGQEVVLTERGKPIAVIKPLPEVSDVAGIIRPALKPGPMPPFRPRRLRGKPISVTLREERDER